MVEPSISKYNKRTWKILHANRNSGRGIRANLFEKARDTRAEVSSAVAYYEQYPLVVTKRVDHDSLSG
jgi:hypothetical protein